MAEILVVDDNAVIREGVCRYLEGDSHVVRTAGSGLEALQEYETRHPDLLLLDVMLPDRSGFEVCTAIRKNDPIIPIIFLSARGGTVDKVQGLSVGADDYMNKPADLCELGARVRALLRRGRYSLVNQNDMMLTFRFGSAEVRGRELVLVNSEGKYHDLSVRECQLLRFMAGNQNRVLFRQELMDFAWGTGYLVYTRTLDTHIYNLRKKTAGCGWEIETVVNHGYRLRTRLHESETV